MRFGLIAVACSFAVLPAQKMELRDGSERHVVLIDVAALLPEPADAALAPRAAPPVGGRLGAMTGNELHQLAAFVRAFAPALTAPGADVQPLGPLTAFDEWCIERERTLTAREATNYVSREVVGYEDLDRHGIWWNEPGYGYVWAPTYISVGWAPYRHGHWAWIGPWGYTWVDHAPWGYAPFHYGRWAYVRHRWCWVPGPRHIRPIWAPALVGWHGMPGVRDPSRAGSVRWYPLAPGEVFVPRYHATPRHVRGVNISSTHIERNSQITNAWRGRLREPPHANRDVPGAMSSLPAAAFRGDRLRVGSGRAVTPAAGAAPAPHLSTLHSGSGSANSWREADSRRTLPRVPTDRRACSRAASSEAGRDTYASRCGRTSSRKTCSSR